MNPNNPIGGDVGNGIGQNSHTQHAASKMSEAGSHLREAAHIAGNTARSAAESAREELRSGSRAVGGELNEAWAASRQAAHEARDVAAEQYDVALQKGRSLLHNVEEMIREKPLQSLGIAVLAGMILSRLSR